MLSKFSLDSAYQGTFVRVFVRLRRQQPLEPDKGILRFAALHLGTDLETNRTYASRRRTIWEYQQTEPLACTFAQMVSVSSDGQCQP